MESTQPEEKKTLEESYKKRGFQQQNLNDYLTLKKQEKHKKFKFPVYLRILFATPFILLFGIGLIFIPYMIFLFIKSFFN